ncbi:MAG TPA: methyltransferase domain-containing protein [Acidimicrobiales bacterium]|nr:methyltransferase domain-containing protein [Acidimicrobiales bacterium]
MDRPTIDIYEGRAAEWAKLRPPRHRTATAAFSERCLPGRVRADLGCGPGSYFADLGRPLSGLDGAEAMLHLARRAAPDAMLVRGDLEHLPFARAGLGGAWARASYLHVARNGLPAALAQLHAALALGAPVELTVRVGDGEGPLPDDDFAGRFFALWQPDALASVVAGAGFRLDGLDDTGDGWLVVRATRDRTLPDFVGPGMRILVCGLNPSVVAADAGYGYAGATNRFWAAASASGLISVPRRPVAALHTDRVGMTDLVKRATPRSSGVLRHEYADGATRVRRLVEWLQPRLVLFVGLEGWRGAIDRAARPGLQAEPFGGAAAYLMPSTSGVNGHATLADLVGHMEAALGYADGR